MKGRTTGGIVIYYPDEGSGQTNNSRTATFQLKDGVAIYGGFEGTETSRTERDWRANVTVLSGDIDQNDTTSDPSGIITDPDDIVGANSYHVVTGNGTAASAVLDGFVITAGSAEESTAPNDVGGGMVIDDGSPTLANLEFIGNRARHGGGLANLNGSSTALTNVAFRSNMGTEYSPSALLSYGGGMVTANSAPTLTNVLFSGNLAASGGGLANIGGNPVLTNVTASGNHGTGAGGGMFNLSGIPQIRNSIFWNNQDSTGTDTPSASIYTSGWQYPTISYSLVQSSGGSGDDWDPNAGTDGGNNVDADPFFVTPTDPAGAPRTSGDLRFPWVSPAVDVGDSALNTTTEDLGGLPRKVDGNADGTVIIDMGAYETPKPELTSVFLPLVMR